MINIMTSNIVSVTADSENPSFPVSMVLDNKVKRKYRAVAGVNTATITANVIGKSTALIMAGTNATSITVTAENPSGCSWAPGNDWVPGTAWVTSDIGLNVNILQRSNSGSIYCDLGDLPSSVVLKIACMAPAGETLEVGTLEIGYGVVLSDYRGIEVNPDYGLTETKKDNSIDDEYSNGSVYYFSRDKVRQFDITVQLSYESGDALLLAYETNGKNPSGWKLADIDSNRWVVFARFDGPPVIAYSNFNEVSATFTLTEVL